MNAASPAVVNHSAAWDVPTEPLTIITSAALAANVTA